MNPSYLLPFTQEAQVRLSPRIRGVESALCWPNWRVCDGANAFWRLPGRQVLPSSNQ